MAGAFLFPSPSLTLINVFILYLGSTNKIQVRIEKEASNDENRPKRRQTLVWTLGVFYIFFIKSLVSLLTNISLILNLRYEKQTKKGGDGENGPKQRLSRRLVHRYSFFFIFFCY